MNYPCYAKSVVYAVPFKELFLKVYVHAGIYGHI